MTHHAIAALSVYAGLNALILFWLMAATGRVRMAEKVLMGDAGNPRLIRVMRGHANAIEVVPVGLLLVLLMALLGAPVWAVHLFGIALTAGRFLHALHFTAADAPGWQRAAGAVSSAFVLLAGGIWAVVAGVLQSV